MSMATRCPDCTTHLDLVPDQLRVAGGWVRCGRCDAVFNATARLERRTGDSDFLGVYPAASTTLLEEKYLAQLPRLPAGVERNSPLVVSPQGHDSPAALDKTSTFVRAHESQAIATPILRPAVADDSINRQDADGLRYLQQPDTKGNLPDRGKPIPAHGKSSTAAITTPATGNVLSLDLPTPSFMRERTDPAVLPARRTRWPLYVGVVLLVIMLAIQIALAHRDRIAASAPAFAPGLQKLCNALGCMIGPARQINALVIDHSSLNKKAAGKYRLQIAVRNQSDTSLATPALELTLTDMQDRPVVRRALLPSDIGAESTIAAQGEWSGAVTMTVAAQEAGRIVGYKVLAFYP